METTATGRGRVLGTAAIVAVPAVASVAATQYLAWRMNYHPALGLPWAGHVYAPWSWAQWMQAPWAGNVSSLFDQVKLGGAGLLGVSAAGLLGAVSRRRRPIRHDGVHGTSRFQTAEEIAAGGLMAREGREHAGIYVGGWTDADGRIHYLRHNGPEHCIVIAPTRSGKGVGNILPTLLSWPASTLVYDEKGELWALTAGWRAGEGGNTAIRLEMGAISGSAGFNFLEEIRLGTPYEVGDAQAIAQMICDPNGDGIEGKDHWGKAQPLDAQVLTPTGFRPMGELRLGDLVQTPDGRSAPVVGLYPQGEKDIYRVTFEDGRSVECCDDHLWKVWKNGVIFETGKSHADRRAIAHGRWVVEPLSRIREWMCQGGRRAGHAAVPLVDPGAIEFPARNLPVSPYALGALIGDGYFPSKARPGSVMFTSADQGILDRMSVELPDYEVSWTGANRGLDYRLVQKERVRRGPLHVALSDLGLLGCGAADKFIPADYKVASAAQRLALVQGLMDTDGWVNEGTHAGFSTVSERLAHDLRDVLWSLGARVKIIRRQNSYTYRGEKKSGRPLWRLTIVHPDVGMLFSLPRKVSACRPKQVHHRLRISSIDLVGRKQAQCIAVDHPDHLYVTDNFVVTHNTSFDLLGATFLHLLYHMRKEGKTASLTDVAYAISDPDNPSDELWEEMRSNKHVGGKRHLFVAAAGQDMIERNERERKSVLSSAKTYLNLVKDPIVASNIKRSDFRIDDLMNHDKPLSLYFTTKGTDKERLRPLTRLFLTMVMRTLMGVELTYVNGQAVMPHRHRLLMMLDEFPSLGKMNVIEDSMPKCAGYGIKFFLAAQDRAQLFKAYTQYQSITGNCHIRLIYAPNEGGTADWISHDIGDMTVIKEDITESGTKGGPLKNISRTFHEVKRPVLTSTEIMALRKPKKDDNDQIVESGQMVVFMAGEWPILGTQILYFIDPVFSARSKIPAPRSDSLRHHRPRFVAA